MGKEENKQSTTNIVPHVEVAAVNRGALESLERAEVDIQIATAKKYPRKLSEFMVKAKEAIRSDKDIAKQCVYNRPVGKDARGNQKMVSGQSIRLAEIVAPAWQNLRVYDVIGEIGERSVKAIGFCFDLEKQCGGAPGGYRIDGDEGGCAI